MPTIAITEHTLQPTVADNEIVLLDFWAAWCGPCRTFGKVFESTSVEHPDVVFGKIDTESERALSAGFNVKGIPLLVAFRQGIILYQQAGALNAPQLNALITELKGVDMDEVRAKLAANNS